MTNVPSPWSVYPANGSMVSVSPASEGQPPLPALYKIVPVATSLPVIDNSKTIKQLLLSVSMRRRVDQHYRRHRRPLLVSFFVGLLSIGVGGMARVEIAQPMAVLSFTCMLPAQISYVLEMRYQFIKLLVQSFEFWYTTTLIILWTVSGATMFSDARVCSLLMPCLGMELQLLGDACTRPMRSLVVSALLTVVLYGSLMFFAAFNLIDQAKILQVAVSRDGRLTISNRDIFINTTLPLMILATRLGFNKYRALKHRNLGGGEELLAPCTLAPLAAVLPPGRIAVTPGVRCMAYRCRLKLQRYSGTAQDHSRHSVDSVPTQPPGSRLLPLRAVTVRELFHARETIMPGSRPRGDLSTWLRLLYQTTGMAGLVASASSFHTHKGDETDMARITVALVCTSVYCGYFFCVSHRSLLRHLLSSFDFVFVLVQTTMELVAVADMYTWQRTASLGGAIPSWMWFWHVMTLDAITPEVKQRLGFRVRYLAPPVLLVFMVGHAWLAAEVLVYNRLGFEDRVLVKLSLGEKPFQLKAASFALTRAMTSFVWSARLLWRIWSSCGASEDALVMLQGYVEFDYVRRRGLESAQAVIVPAGSNS